jgi:endonuclease/exonuclease/phosphatase family metal-dependent hydrolase
LEVFLQTPVGPLHVMNTHKGLKSTERGLQLAKLNDLLLKQSEIPLIVGGDLNEWQTSSRALKKLDLVLNSMPTAATFPTVFPVFKLDRMWCRPAKVFKSIHVLKTPETKKYSDHFPIIAEIEL